MVQRGNNVVQRCYNVAKNETECELKACTTLCSVSATLWYVMIRSDTLCCVGTASHNEAHGGDSDVIAWRQRGITRL